MGLPIAKPKGLSPYTRGNRESILDYLTLDGSIPVHTGKPFDKDA